MHEKVLKPIALHASARSEPFPSPGRIRSETALKLLTRCRSKTPFQSFQVSGVTPATDEPLWKMIEFKLVNDEVAPLDKMNFLGLLCKVRAGQDMNVPVRSGCSG